MIQKNLSDQNKHVTAPPLTIKRTLRLLSRYLPFLFPMWPQLFLLFFMLPLAGSIITVIPALCTKMIIDVAFPRKSVTLLAIFGGLAVLMIIMERVLCVIVRNATSGYLRAKVINALGSIFYKNMLHLNMQYHQLTPVGEKIFRSDTDILDTAELLGFAFPMTIQYTCQFLITVITICMIDWRPMALTAALSPLFFFIAQKFFNYYRSIDAWQRKEGERLTAVIEQSMRNLAVVYASGARSENRFKYYAQLIRYTLANMIYSFLHLVTVIVVWPSGFPAMISGYLIGLSSYWVVKGTMTLGEWQAIGSLISQAIVPLGILLTYYQVIRLRMIPAERIIMLLDSDFREKDQENATAIEGQLRGDIEFKNVFFGYTPEKKVLKGLSFVIPAGSRVAFVGPSGIGKSTILNLLLRFYEPDAGQILVDGKDIKTYRLADYRKQFGIVLQSPVVFDRTLRENIFYGINNTDNHNIDTILTSTGLAELIKNLPNGLETNIQQSGLSLGQKQSITVSRCMAFQPNIFLFDEPTALVDPDWKQVIVQSIDALAAGKTTVFISHDLLTLKNLDTIMVLADGVVAEKGSHEHLLSINGTYKKLWDMQTSRIVKKQYEN